MSAPHVTPVEPTSGTLIGAVYPQPDYFDSFKITGLEGAPIEDFATSFFLSQPKWLAKVSMNLGGRQSLLEAIDGHAYRDGSSVGSWKVHARTEDEIMFGEHMGFMEYRLSFLRRPDGHVEASTSVKYLTRFASFYFGIVKPFHMGFIKIALRNAAKHVTDQAVAK